MLISVDAAFDMDFTSEESAKRAADPEIMSRNTHTDERKLSYREKLPPTTTMDASQSATVAAICGG